MLIGIAGAAGSGKSTAAELITTILPNSKAYALADKVKEVCKIVFGFSDIEFSDRELKEKIKPSVGLSPRTAAQLVGTECFRREFGEDVWIKTLIRQMERDKKDGIENRVIQDIRFQNEAEWCLKYGILIHLTRPGYDGNVGISGHASENSLGINELLDDFPSLQENYFQVQNTGTIDELKESIESIISFKNSEIISD